MSTCATILTEPPVSVRVTGHRRATTPRWGRPGPMVSPSARPAATVLRFLGRRVGAEVAEGLVGELFRIAFERPKTFDASRASALPWLYGIGSNLLLKHRRGEARRLRASERLGARVVGQMEVV